MSTYDDRQSKKSGLWIAIAAAVVLVALIASCGDDDPPRPSGTADRASRAAATTVEPGSEQDVGAEPRALAEDSEAAGDFDVAIAEYEALGDDAEADRVRKRAASELVARARAAYRAGRYRTAERRAKAAIRRYEAANAKGAARIRDRSRAKLRSQRERARQRAEAARVAREQRAARRREERRRAREQAAAAAATEQAAEAAGNDGAQVGPGPYAGMNCTEIGHSFRVVPGSDPEHDRDNDGIACESQ